MTLLYRRSNLNGKFVFSKIVLNISYKYIVETFLNYENPLRVIKFLLLCIDFSYISS